MTMNKVADRIDIRYAGNEIQDTGAESHVRGGSDIEYKSAGCDYRWRAGCYENGESHIPMPWSVKGILEPESIDRSDEDNEHGKQIAFEKTAERSIGKTCQYGDKNRIETLRTADTLKFLLRIFQPRSAVPYVPWEARQAWDEIEIKTHSWDFLVHRVRLVWILLSHRHHNRAWQYGEIHIVAEALCHTIDRLLASCRRTASRKNHCRITGKKLSSSIHLYNPCKSFCPYYCPHRHSDRLCHHKQIHNHLLWRKPDDAFW